MTKHGSKATRWRSRRWGAFFALLAVCAATFAAVLATLGARAAGHRSSPSRIPVVRSASSQTIAGLPAAVAAHAAESAQGPYQLGTVLVGFRNGVSPARELAIEHAVGARSATRLGPTIKPVGHGPTTGEEYLAPMSVRVADAQTAPAVQALKRYPEVAYAELNYFQRGTAKPNDPEFGKQWGDENTGQAIPFQDQEEKLGAEEKGTPGADDKAYQAWSVTKGSRSIVIGEVDTGVAYEHPDLAANIWSNPSKIGGCATGTHGYNVLNKTCNPIDEDTTYNGHGTHVAGIIGAVGNNSAGVAGMNWETTILPVRWMTNASSGTTEALIAALQWLVAAKQEGVNVRVVNDSDTFFGTAKSETLSKEIETLGANNILFVTAAGNTGNNNDEEKVQRYPCSYDRSNEICVTATNNKDQLPTWANYGPKTVQLAAPGVSIFSTLRKNEYGWLTGGSMASPQVAGAAGLILSVSPSMSATEVRSRILSNVDKLPSLEGTHGVETGGRLNVCRAVPGCTEEKTKEEEKPKEETLGYKEIGGLSDKFETEKKRVNRYALPTNGWVTRLSIYLAPTSTTGQQVMKGVIYSDASGKPEKLLGVTEPLTYKGTEAAGWYNLPLKSGLQLSAGTYWIGVITGPTNSVAGFKWTSVTGARVANNNTYSAGPTNPFGTVEKTDAEQTSLYATYFAVPVNTVPPTISGEARQGQTLTDVHGTWANEPTGFTYKWLQCDSSGNNCAGIGGATKQTYEIVAGDVGHTIKVQETASNAKGSGSAGTSSASAVVLPLPPSGGTPTISGEARQGQTLTEAHGTWSNTPTSFSYKWQRCESSGSGCVAIAGAESQTYALVEADVGKTIKVIEKATNAGGSGEGTSTATAIVLPLPPSGGTPTISGEARQGQTLTEAHGTWSNTPTSFSYKWQRCESSGSGCVAIAGAESQTYVLVEADVGKTIKVIEKATNAGGSGEGTSTATAIVLPLPPSGGTPTISGEARQGQTLTEAHGTWSNTPTSFSYKWQRCESSGSGCVAIAGAESQTYVLVEADVGKTIKVIEKATNAGGSGEGTSTATAIVLPLPPSGGTPTISGEARQGKTLTEAHGTWSNNPTSFSYKWQRCDGAGNNCANIAGAESQTYLPVETDVGHTVKVVETAKNAGGSGEGTSSATAVIAPLPVPTIKEVPTISGEARQGKTLTETHGKWTNEPISSYAIKWQRCDSSGNNCANIAGAESQTYLLTEADVGHRLKVQESATNDGGTSEPATSGSTEVVVPPPPAIKEAPTISGEARQGKALTEAHGKWTNEPITAYAYQWLQCTSLGESCLPISGAKNQAYVPVEGDVGHKLRVQETATNAGGTSEPALSEATAVVGSLVPELKKAPGIVPSEARQGQTLTETHGEWTNSPTSYAYQWLQCNSEGTLSSCTFISGATNQTYTPEPADVGHRLRVQETASNSAGPSAPAPSEPTEAVKPPAPKCTAPTITGEAQQGKTLTEHHGSCMNGPVSFSYKWLRCESSGNGCSPITGAESQTYLLAEADVGHRLKVQENASSAGGTSEMVSEPTAVVVVGAPTIEKAPTVSGEARQGQTLTEAHGTWSNNPTGFSYKWQRCDSSGNNCASIAGAEGQTYVLLEADVGHTIKVVEAAKNTGGSGEGTSTATAVVLPLAPSGGTPTISGEARQGQTLTEAHGTWSNNPTSFSYKWQRCDGSGNNCASIAGAESQTYLLLEADVGHKVRVIETATNAGGSGEGASAPTEVVKPLAPSNVTPPTITGTAQQGQTLTEHHGEWANGPTGYAYKWLQCNGEGTLSSCSAIAGAEGPTYAPVEGDVGHRLRVQETATNAGGSSAPAISEPTEVVVPLVPTPIKAPTITGEARQGQVLTEHHGEWTNGPTGYAYKWLQCNSSGEACSPIAGAESSTYVPVEGDAGHRIKVQETASNAAGPTTTPAVSQPTEVVKPLPPTNEKAPTIEGKAQEGETLTEAHGIWTHNPTGYSYQWLQCNSLSNECLPIASANKQTYTPTASDVGNTLKVQETASNAGGPSSPATSAATEPVLAGGGVPTPDNQPTISGEARQGKTLTEQSASWKGEPTSFSYAWLRCDSAGNNCATIGAANKQTYALTEADVGHRIRVQEEATNLFGTSNPDVSEATAVVVPPVPTIIKAPAISGEARQGQTLSEQHGEWTNNPTGYTYKWLQCNSAGEACAPIAGAESSTYVLQEGDVGHRIKVQETAANGGGPGEPATSEASEVVKPLPPTIVSAPTISGTAQQAQTLTEHHGEWKNSPTGYAYKWLQCNSAGELCASIAGAEGSTYVVQEGDVGHRLRVQETASNAGGASVPATSEATAVVTPPVPTIIKAPTITGEARQGQLLTEHHGEWANNPTAYSYHWLQCNSLGEGCLPIAGAEGSTYTPVEGDAGHRLRVQETASNSAGPGAPASSEATEVVQPQAPGLLSAPTISGTAQQGQTLTEVHGKWTNNPTGFAYKWLQCTSSGETCTPIAGAESQTYVPSEADVGHALEVQESASNAGGTSEPATSSATEPVRAASGTFGQTNVGASKDVFAAARKRVNRYALSAPGSVTKLTIYLESTPKAGQQVMKGILYADEAGAPSALLGVTEQFTFTHGNAARWYDMPFASPVHLAAGNYWIGVITGGTGNVAGFRFDSVAGSRDFNANAFAGGPSNPFGPVTVDSEQASLYATYTPG